MKIGILTGSGLSASLVYAMANKDVVLRDIDLKSLLSSGYVNIDPTPYYREVVEWFKANGITHGSVGCNSYNDIGMSLFRQYGIKPINDITEILFKEVKKYCLVGWISTSTFRSKIPRSIRVKHISNSDQLIVDRIIFDELSLGIVSEESTNEIRRIVHSLKCEDTVFGCTDLSILVDKMDTNIIDSVQLHLRHFR
jgi:hypothetical protein